MRKGREGEKRKKITAEIVATNVIDSRPPNGDRLQHRPLVPKWYYIEKNYLFLWGNICTQA